MTKREFIDLEAESGAQLRRDDVTGVALNENGRKLKGMYSSERPLRTVVTTEWPHTRLFKIVSNRLFGTNYKVRWRFESRYSWWKRPEVVFHRRSGRPFAITFPSLASAQQYYTRKLRELELGISEDD
jgi:hypothetical protein